MKFRSVLLIFLIITSISCSSKPDQIPQGTWNYDLLVNGVKAGRAVSSNTLEGDNYVIRSEMYLNMGSIENKSVQTVIETKDFKPVKLEVLNTVTDTTGVSSQDINKTATFNGKEVTLIAGDYKSRFTINDPFVLDGNYFFSELLKNNFEEGVIIKSHIYEPSVEIDTPILVIVEVKGMETVQIGNKSMKLLHIKQRIEKLKSMDIYMNEKGITEKIVIKMLNNVFELVRVE
ncbi:MAG: hypothetical protein CVV49_22045 [Spirochaetae bacterium HGW-Spirochaetae-5]|nr:MAG: hypothetical protein CVV49_22045 [Spirochaetae bacterium HGW-Spirochaetae-5]